VPLADHHYQASKSITSKLVQSIVHQDTTFDSDPLSTNPALNEIKKTKKQQLDVEYNSIYESLDLSTRRLVDCACERGASTWLPAIPLEEHGFSLSKSTFWDALCLRYGWQIPSMSLKCACGMSMSVDHAMVCHKGSIPTLRHNEIRDLTAALLAEAYPNVSTEPALQPIDDAVFFHRTANRDDSARLDIRASDFWLRGREAFFDVRVFYPIAPSYRHKELAALYKAHENEKKRSYNQRVMEAERGSFTPLVLASTGGIAKEATIFFKRRAYILSDKKKISFGKMMFLIRCKISFALLRSAIRAIRGSRSRPSYYTISPDSDFHRMHAEAMPMGSGLFGITNWS
jgi:hypothetical protein